jgi:hypothetical protein
MADTLTIKTNRRPRPVLYWHDLTARERNQFDYLDTESAQESATFTRYRGWVHDLGEFQTTHGMPEFSPLTGWHGYHADSYFSGVLVRYTQDHESIVMATFFS